MYGGSVKWRFLNHVVREILRKMGGTQTAKDHATHPVMA